MKNKEKYKDIIQYIESRLALKEAIDDLCKEKDYYQKQKYEYIVEQEQRKIEEWLENDTN